MSTKLLFFALVALLWASPAFAQDSLDKAVGVANEASQLFQAEDYVGAAQKFKEAYALYPDITLLKNQIVAYYRAGLCKEVIQYGKDYQTNEASQSVSDREDVRFMRVECLYRAAYAAYQANDIAQAETEISTARSIGIKNDDEVAKFRKLEDLIEKRKNPDVQTETPSPAAASSGTEVLPIVGWSLAGVGAAGLVVSGILHLTYFLDYSDQSDEFKRIEADALRDGDNETYVQNRADWDQAFDDTDSKIGGLTPIYAVSGAFLAAGGGILVYHYFIADDGTTTATIAPLLSSDRAGIQLGLEF